MTEVIPQNGSSVPSAFDLINNAQTIAIVPSKVAGPNAFSAAVGLFYMLQDSGKKVKFIHQGKIPDECVNLISKEEIDSTVSDRELEVAIDYSTTPAAKAHWSHENEILFITLSPVPKNFDIEHLVRARITGFDFDVAIVVGAQVLEDLGQTYNELRDEFKRAKIINIDNTNRNQKFGTVNIVDADSDDLSSVVFKQAAEWKMVPGKKSAKALLTGMTYKESRIDSSRQS